MANRYAEDIRRIAKTDEAKGGLADAEARDTILGARGVAYFESADSIVGVSGAPNETLAPASTTGDVVDGQVNESADQVTSESDGTESAADLLDGSLEIGDSLKEIQAEDCESGSGMNIRTDGEFIPPAATTTIDSAGDPVELTIAWSDADTPPDKVGWVSGTAWRRGSPTPDAAENYSTAYEAFLSSVAELTAASPLTFTGGFTVILADITSSSYGINANLDLVGGGTAGQSFVGTGSACTPGSSTFCPSSNPTEEAWPESHQDFSFIHTFRDGKFISNIYDSNLETDHIADLAHIDFCNGDDSRVGRMEPTSNGGFMISERDGVGGVALGQYQVFKNNGTLIDFVGEATAELLRPPA